MLAKIIGTSPARGRLPVNEPKIARELRVYRNISPARPPADELSAIFESSGKHADYAERLVQARLKMRALDSVWRESRSDLLEKYRLAKGITERSLIIDECLRNGGLSEMFALHASLFSGVFSENWASMSIGELRETRDGYEAMMEDFYIRTVQCFMRDKLDAFIIDYMASKREAGGADGDNPSLKRVIPGDSAAGKDVCPLPSSCATAKGGVPCYKVADDSGLEYFLVPAKARVLKAMSSIYGVERPNPLIPQSRKGEALGNPESAMFPDVFSRETGTVFAGEASLGEWIDGLSDSPDYLFYKFLIL